MGCGADVGVLWVGSIVGSPFWSFSGLSYSWAFPHCKAQPQGRIIIQKQIPLLPTVIVAPQLAGSSGCHSQVECLFRYSKLKKARLDRLQGHVEQDKPPQLREARLWGMAMKQTG